MGALCANVSKFVLRLMCVSTLIRSNSLILGSDSLFECYDNNTKYLQTHQIIQKNKYNIIENYLMIRLNFRLIF